MTRVGQLTLVNMLARADTRELSTRSHRRVGRRLVGYELDIAGDIKFWKDIVVQRAAVRD
jgi:hypothetical protein